MGFNEAIGLEEQMKRMAYEFTYKEIEIREICRSMINRNQMLFDDRIEELKQNEKMFKDMVFEVTEIIMRKESNIIAAHGGIPMQLIAHFVYQKFSTMLEVKEEEYRMKGLHEIQTKEFRERVTSWMDEIVEDYEDIFVDITKNYGWAAMKSVSRIIIKLGEVEPILNNLPDFIVFQFIMSIIADKYCKEKLKGEMDEWRPTTKKVLNSMENVEEILSTYDKSSTDWLITATEQVKELNDPIAEAIFAWSIS